MNSEVRNEVLDFCLFPTTETLRTLAIGTGFILSFTFCYSPLLQAQHLSYSEVLTVTEFPIMSLVLPEDIN